MKKLKFILFIISLFFIFTINTNAQINLNTTYNIEFDDSWINVNNKYSMYSQSFKDIFDYIISLDSDYYDISIRLYKNSINVTSGQQEFYIDLYPKNTTISLQFSGINSTNHFNTSNSTIPNGKEFYFYGNYSSSQYDFFSSEIYTKFLDCYLNNRCASSYTSYSGGSVSIGRFKPIEPYYYDSNLTFNNNDSFNLVADNTYNENLIRWLYYTDLNLLYSTSLSNNNDIFVKNLSINGNTIVEGDSIPTYLDLFSSNIDNSYVKQFDSQVNTIYSKVPIDKVNNYNMTFEFSPTSLPLNDYISLNFNVMVSGRVNHTNYYTYEDLYCDFYDIQKDTLDNSLLYTFSGIVCDNSVTLSNYDYIYFTLVPDYANWNNTYSKDVFGIKLNANFGDFTYNKYSGSIYESFKDLSNYFKLFLSSTGNLSLLNDVSLYSSNSSTWYNAYNLNDLSLDTNYKGRVTQSGDIFSDFPILTHLHLNDTSMLTKDYGFMVYDNDNTDSTNLYLYFNSNIILSFGSNDNFYYYNTTTDQIENSIISVQYEVDSSSNDYDISLSINSINSYIDSLREEISQFGDLIQNFYNSLPEYVRGFIYIMFNLVCLKQVIKLIKNDNGKE